MPARHLHISPDLSLPPETVTQTLIVYGGKGMGKTVFCSVVAEELARAGQRFSLLDPLGVNWGLQSSADGKSAGIEVLILGGKHGDIPIEPSAGAVVADLVVDESVSVVIDFSRHANGKLWSRGEKIRFVADYCTRLYERQGEQMRPLMQIIDEAGRFVPQLIPHGSIDLARCVSAIEQLVEEGRNFGIGVLLITQRSARMNKSVSELADMMVAFRTVGPNSLKAIDDWLSENIPKERRTAIMDEVRRLPIGTAVVVSPGWLDIEKIVPIRMRETFNSSATPKAGARLNAPTKRAQIDIQQYRARMAATIEKVKQDDPKELRSIIADLKRKLAVKPATVSVQQPAQQVRVEVPVPVLSAEDRALLERSTKAMLTFEEGLRIASTAALREVERASQVVVGALAKLQAIPAPVKNASPVAPASQPFKHGRTNKYLLDEATALDDASDEVSDDAPLTKGARIVLTYIAQVGEATREQLSVSTGYKKTSRDTYLKQLKSRQLIETTADGSLSATAAGITALGAGYKPLPVGAQLRTYWLERLGGGEKALLEVLVAEYPRALMRDLLGERTNYKKTSRDTFIKRLLARKLVVNSGGALTAAAMLFD